MRERERVRGGERQGRNVSKICYCCKQETNVCCMQSDKCHEIFNWPTSTERERETPILRSSSRKILGIAYKIYRYVAKLMWRSGKMG